MGKIIATGCGEGKVQDFALLKASRTGFASASVCLADSGYQGLEKRCPHARTPQKKSKHRPLTDEDKASNRAIARDRIGCEHVMGRLKVFERLSQTYCNRRKRFGLRFILLAAICNPFDESRIMQEFSYLLNYGLDCKKRKGLSHV